LLEVALSELNRIKTNRADDYKKLENELSTIFGSAQQSYAYLISLINILDKAQERAVTSKQDKEGQITYTKKSISTNKMKLKDKKKFIQEECKLRIKMIYDKWDRKNVEKPLISSKQKTLLDEVGTPINYPIVKKMLEIACFTLPQLGLLYLWTSDQGRGFLKNRCKNALISGPVALKTTLWTLFVHNQTSYLLERNARA